MALKDFDEFPHLEGKVERVIFGDPPWDKLDWRIFHFMKGNVRQKFTVVARNTDTTSGTAKLRFYEKILPNCVIANYFFPKGFEYYSPLFLRLKTQNETNIIKGLEKLPCTSYVFPLDRSLVLILFYDSKDDIITLLNILQKKEENAIIDSYLLYSPIVYTK